MIASSLVALGGIGLGLYLWVSKPGLPAALASGAGGLYRAVREKFYVDEIYDTLLVQNFYRLCRAMSLFDSKAVDGMVNGAGATMEISGQVLKIFHTGFLRNYALFYLAGAAAIAWYLVG